MNVPVRNLSEALLHLDILKDQLAEAKVELDAARAEAARSVGALRKIGEELKSVASDKEEEVRDDFTSGQSHGWAMAYLHVVQILGNKDNSQPAIAWLDQQRREAVATWVEKEATEYRRRMGEYYERSVEGMLEEAAAIRAGQSMERLEVVNESKEESI